MITASRIAPSRPPRRWLALGAWICSVIAPIAASPGPAHAGVPPEGVRPYLAIASGTSHTCAVISDGTVKCWGSNDFGQVGTGIDTLFTGPIHHGMSTEDQPMPQAPVAGSCTHDYDCPTHNCNMGTCASNNCPNADTCASNHCTAPSGACSLNSDCPSGDCDTTAHQCRCGIVCPLASDASGNTCVPHACICYGGSCGALHQDDDCPWGYTCSAVSHACVPWEPIPVPIVPGISNAIAVAAGDMHSCALIADGTIKCWGENSSGQLGTGDFNSSSTPVQVSGIGGGSTPAIAIAAGAYHTCAVLSNGTVKCWGDDSQFQLGSGSSPGYTRSNTPVIAGPGSPPPPIKPTLTTVTAITAGSYHTCALLATGAIKCWGSNSNGQIGDGSTTTRALPTNVSSIGPSTSLRAVKVAAGRLHTCALVLSSSSGTNTGTVTCWGYNGNQQLDADTASDYSTPTGTALSGDIRDITANGDHTCALMGNGTVKCWGDNQSGQLGNGSSGNPNVTLDPVSSLAGVTTISAGYTHSCASLANGTVKCWGNNWHSQIGDNTLIERDAPSSAVNGVTSVTNGWQIAAGYLHTCGLLPNGTVKCWGADDHKQIGHSGSAGGTNPTPVLVDGISAAISLCSGGSHSCALIADGSVACWGSDGSAQLGDGNSTDQDMPTSPSLSRAAVQIGCGWAHTCALLTDGTIQCWGFNDTHQVDSSMTSPQTSVVTVVDASSHAIGWNFQVVAGREHTCALRAGAVNCWGYNSSGQLGSSGTPTYPTAVNSLSSTKSLALGWWHSCAVLADGTAKCWGSSSDGQLGNNTTGTTSSTPVTVSGLSGALALGAGGAHTCAVMADSTFQCWGRNADGQLGTTTTVEHDTPGPVVISPLGVQLAPGAAITCGEKHTCATLIDGHAKCWGDNSSGQIGNTTTTGSPYTTPDGVSNFP